MASRRRAAGIALAVVGAMVAGAEAAEKRSLNVDDLAVITEKLDMVSATVNGNHSKLLDANRYLMVVLIIVIVALLILLWMFHSEVKRLKRIEDDVEGGLTRKNSLNHKKSMANSALYSRREKDETDHIQRLPTMSRVPGNH